MRFGTDPEDLVFGPGHPRFIYSTAPSELPLLLTGGARALEWLAARARVCRALREMGAEVDAIEWAWPSFEETLIRRDIERATGLL